MLAVHDPAPSQVPTVMDPALHESQTVPLGHTLQAPVPLQPPVLPQDAMLAAGHSLCGSPPSLTAPHTPSTPCPFEAAEQA